MPDNSTPDDNGREAALRLLRQRIANAANGQGDNPELERPDPITQRAEYERWYHGLSREQKQAEWQLYHSASQAQDTAAQTDEIQTPRQHLPVTSPEPSHNHGHNSVPSAPIPTIAHKGRTKIAPTLSAAAVREKALLKRASLKQTAAKHEHNFRAAALAVTIAFVLLFIMNNDFFIAQAKSYVTPSSTSGQSATIVQTSEAVGPESKIIIPKIGVEAPVVFDQNSLEESAIQASLNDGVVRYNYPGTVMPGQNGNSVILGHSSGNFFNDGKYKFAFVLLSKLEKGDSFIIHYNSQRYVYRVFDEVTVAPTDFGQITEKFDRPVVTLITCDPPGTNWNRLIIQGEQVSPDPGQTSVNSEPAAQSSTQNAEPTSIPSDSRSLWSRVWPF